MTPQERILNTIREALIEKHGDEFLSLTDKEQTLIICDELNKQFERIRKGE